MLNVKNVSNPNNLVYGIELKDGKNIYFNSPIRADMVNKSKPIYYGQKYELK